MVLHEPKKCLGQEQILFSKQGFKGIDWLDVFVMKIVTLLSFSGMFSLFSVVTFPNKYEVHKYQTINKDISRLLYSKYFVL